MPIRARLPKSGMKKVSKQRVRHTPKRLDKAAQDLFRDDGPDLTPGTAGLTDRIKTKQQQSAKRRSQTVLQGRRRHVSRTHGKV